MSVDSAAVPVAPAIPAAGKVPGRVAKPASDMPEYVASLAGTEPASDASPMLPGADKTEAPFEQMLSETALPASPLRAALADAYRLREEICVQRLYAENTRIDALTAGSGAAASADARIDLLARRLIGAVRSQRARASGVDALMQEFSLSSDEGVALMCMAEALLRIPDVATADRLIADKLGKGDWRSHLGESPSLFVNAATWGLLITGKLVATRSETGLRAALGRLITKGGEPLVRKGVDLAMRMLGNQFVAGQTIGEAIENSRPCVERGYQYSYDMLGEAAVTSADAERYFDAYENALHAIGKTAGGRGVHAGPGISVKLSALHPRYGRAQKARVMAELLPRLKKLVLLAKHYAVGINIDAEEADRLEISLDLLEALAFDPELAGFDGLGFVVQAYQKRCPYVIDYLADLASRSGRKFMVRLVKGAYWDSEIKRAQVDGMPDYPVYTRKVHTDLSYLVCAKKLLAHAAWLYPQFATHNAQTLAAVHTWASDAGVVDYEFQCLHGMGETLYDQVIGNGTGGNGSGGTDKGGSSAGIGVHCRIYAPVGPHRTLLAYLVRRLLENGANSSFVNRLVDPAVGIDELVRDPFAVAAVGAGRPHAQIGLPSMLYGAGRRNSLGTDFSDEGTLHAVAENCAITARHTWHAKALVAATGVADKMPQRAIVNPADRRDPVGDVLEASDAELESALAAAAQACGAWQDTAPAERAQCLLRAAQSLEDERYLLMSLLVREAGKSLPSAAGEVREAVDFLRFYAAQINDAPQPRGLGVAVCISPWNFPLAIFIGQVGAALAAGNVVLAKPAEQTPLVAYRAVELLHAAGVPVAALQFLPGAGTLGARLVADSRVDAVLFTGSTAVAQKINRTLAGRAALERRELPLIAETGGQNAMIVDSSALPEQVIMDVLASAFDSAGQRCSALRVLCLQDEVADEILAMLHGALQELRIGKPDRLSNDIGPVIDAAARARLLAHVAQMRDAGARVTEMHIADGYASQEPALQEGTFVLPTIIEIAALDCLQQEVFGPVLHVLRYARNGLPGLIDAINDTGYGLTLGIHSRIDETIDFIIARARVGNIYVNRNMIGAVVGSQPFGGEGKSGTGPKAGGPLYLHRLQCAHPMTGIRAAHQAGSHSYDRTDINAPTAMPPLPRGAAYPAWRSWIGSQQHGACLGADPSALEADSSVPSLVLPGPTGEHNSLSLHPRGVVLCVPASRWSILQQLDAIFMTGNTALVQDEHAVLLPQTLPQAIAAKIKRIPASQLDRAEFQAALVDDTIIADWHERLAARDGLLIQAIATSVEQPVALQRLVVERTVSVNTTAAGGNANLMMIAT